MKAVITGTPLQIEGEPAEIAQLCELLGSGAVKYPPASATLIADASWASEVSEKVQPTLVPCRETGYTARTCPKRVAA